MTTLLRRSTHIWTIYFSRVTKHLYFVFSPLVSTCKPVEDAFKSVRCMLNPFPANWKSSSGAGAHLCRAAAPRRGVRLELAARWAVGRIGRSGPRRRGCGSEPGRWRKQLLNERFSNIITRLGFFLFFPPSSWSRKSTGCGCRPLPSTSHQLEVWNLLFDAAQLRAALLLCLFLAAF